MIVARRLFDDRRRSLMWWAIGFVVIIALVILVYPSIEGQTDLEKLFRKMPATIKAMVGARAGISIISPAGYLHGRLFAIFIPLLLTIFGISLGASAIGGAEADGTLELLLSNPISRTRVFVERSAVVVVLVVALAALSAVAVTVFTRVVGGAMAEISVGRVVAATFGAACISLLHATIALAAGCITGSRARAVAAATIVAVGGYVIQILTATVASLSWLGALSPWRWYLDRILLVDDLGWRATALPLGLSVVVAAVGLRAFVGRDLR